MKNHQSFSMEKWVLSLPSAPISILDFPYTMEALEANALFQQRKLKGVSRADRPSCGARTRAGGFCKAQALVNGKCRMHGGLSTGPRTKAGKASQRRHACALMQQRWAKLRAEGKTAVALSETGRLRRGEAARRTMRMRHRRREALEWAEWMMRHHADATIRVWGEPRMQVILRPYEIALKSGGIEGLCDLAEVAGIDVRSFANGPECLGAILSRYCPGSTYWPRLPICKRAQRCHVILRAQKSDTNVELPEAGFAARDDRSEIQTDPSVQDLREAVCRALFAERLLV